MPLTTIQSQALKAFIAADPVLSVFPNNNDSYFTIASLLNEQQSPDWIIWRTAVSRDEVMLNGFNWTRVDNLSVGKARIWDWLFNTGFINPSKTNIRAGIDATWVGTQADLDVRVAIYVHCKKLASKIQKIFSIGTGSDAIPATLDNNIEEDFILSSNDVDTAMNLL